MLRPIRRHVKGCGHYKKWGLDCPPKTKLKCPLIIVRYVTGPGGRKIRTEQSLGTNDETLAWQLISQMVISGGTQPPEPPKTAKECINGFLDLEAKRGIGEATLKSFRKFLCGSPKRNPNGNFSPTLLDLPQGKIRPLRT